VSRVDCVVATYHGDDLGLDGLVQGDQAEVEGEVELLGILASVSGYISVVGLGVFCAGLWTYGGDEEEDGESLLSACHDEGRERGCLRKWRFGE
jgi:hypothetical protein